MAMSVIPDEEEEAVLDLPTLQMSEALLPSDYPLFSWEDWPDSLAALVPGGPTKNFEKACWNAVIDAFSGALEAAGLPFYRFDEGLTPEHLKITQGKYGRLLATVMNTTVAAIDDVVPLPWQWSYDVNYRGFLKGYRSSFRGSSWTYRYPERDLSPDVVYPEYILDLVRRINMVIEFMRDTYPYTQTMQATLHSSSLVTPGLRRGISGPITARKKIPLLIADTPLKVAKGLPAAAALLSRLNTTLAPELLRSASIRVWMPIASPIKASAEVRAAAAMHPQGVRSGSNPYVNLEQIFPAELFTAETMASTLAGAAMELMEGIPLEGQALSRSLPAAAADQLPCIHTGARMMAHTLHHAVGAQLPPQPIEAAGHVRSQTRAAAATGQMTSTEARQRSGTKSEAEAHAGIAAASGASHLIRSAAEAQVLPVESLPVALRQASAIGVELDILKGKVRPGWAEQKSAIQAEPAIVLVESAVIGAGQRSACRMSPGIALEPSSPITAAKVCTASVKCALDTGWLPPVWVDGGLWIRQVYDAVQNEDGSLEVS